jgi:hypothetical protein
MSAELNPLSFRDALSHAGRSDFGGNYYSTEYGRTAAKAVERARVFDYMMEALGAHYRIRLLSLPSIDWAFERMFMARYRHTQLVGLERSFSVYARARRQIPVGATDKIRKARDVQDRLMAYGNSTIAYSRVPAHRTHSKNPGPVWGANRLALMSAETYATVMTTDYRASMEQRKKFFTHFYMRNAAWLDFTGPLTAGLESVLTHAPLFMTPGQPNPFVLTVLNCRDRFRGAEARIARMQEVQPAYQIDKHWTYEGKGGVSMLTVCGRMK